jgi:hypothetical protein
MAKRGQSLPWKVQYRWDNGVRGTVPFSSEDEAQMRADKIRRAAEAQDREVTVTVEFVQKKA